MDSSAPIFRFTEQREDLLQTVIGRVVDEARDPIYLLNDAAYHEIRRLESTRGEERERIHHWRKLARSLGDLAANDARQLLRDEAEYAARDVNGNFHRGVYALATRVMPGGMSVLLNPRVLLERNPFEIARGDALAERVVTSGPIARIRALAEHGTLVYVPTHLSNLDSPVFAWALLSSGLPPVTYGAGKNLFTNPVLSFFMRNLGAYRVDRRLRHELYKLVLKTYSCVLIERGFHSLFFPGGTRSRSGGVERKLKLGLAGTGLEAFVRSARAGRRQRVYFVPATINYMLTLEAETLIDDHLKEAGKARYIIEDDESTRLSRIRDLSNRLLQMEGSCAVRFGQPVDPFGNEAREDGESYDAHGRRVDPSTYVMPSEEPAEPKLEHARDAQYTRELADVIMESYLRDTIAMPTHVVATAAFARLRAQHPHADLFALVRRHDQVVVAESELLEEIGRVQAKLDSLESRGHIVLSASVRGATAAELLHDAERALNGYHASPVLLRRDGGVGLLDPKVLLYYQNRLAAHGVAWEGGVGK